MICSISGRSGLGFLSDDRNIHRHLPPTVDRIARIDQLGLDDGAAAFLRIEIGARQEDHPDRQPVRQHFMAAIGDGVVEKPLRQVDMNARAVAGLAIGIDRAAVPHGFQRIDRRLDHPPRGHPVGRRNKADAARIGFEFGSVHAVAGKAFVLGGGKTCHFCSSCSFVMYAIISDDVPSRVSRSSQARLARSA